MDGKECFDGGFIHIFRDSRRQDAYASMACKYRFSKLGMVLEVVGGIYCIRNALPLNLNILEVARSFEKCKRNSSRFMVSVMPRIHVSGSLGRYCKYLLASSNTNLRVLR
jgi:hypothetical protein